MPMSHLKDNPPRDLVFIGAGNMAEALLRGILAADIRSPHQIVLTDLREDRLAELREGFGVRTQTDNAGAVLNAETVLLCVKPQQFDEVLADLKGQIPSDALVISIAAGIPTARIEALLGAGTRVVRVMPNTPALVQHGAAGLAAGRHANAQDVDWAQTLLRAVGQCVEVTEDEIHAVTAVSGSGPAYVFYLMEAMLRAAADLGLDPAVARDLVIQTVEGSARLLRASPETPEVLRSRVTSKGGTTAAAIAVFEQAGVGEALAAGVRAAAHRSRELAGA
jgi:pyrroline-5-carboxylate reductase